jgi:hypothetical protein
LTNFDSLILVLVSSLLLSACPSLIFFIGCFASVGRSVIFSCKGLTSKTQPEQEPQPQVKSYIFSLPFSFFTNILQPNLEMDRSRTQPGLTHFKPAPDLVRRLSFSS